MNESDLICEMLHVLVSRHAYGKPLPKDLVVNFAGIPADLQGDAKQAFEEMRDLEFIESHGNQGIKLDNGRFGELADHLFFVCEEEPLAIKTRLHHYEGWHEHDWI